MAVPDGVDMIAATSRSGKPDQPVALCAAAARLEA
jgi:hypothetical protein